MMKEILAFGGDWTPLEKARRTLAQPILIGNRRLSCALDIRVNGKCGVWWEIYARFQRFQRASRSGFEALP
jgi:hypothetical protein